MKPKIKHTHPLIWILEPLEGDPSFFRKRMFGCEAAYVHERLMLVLASGEEPWNGLLVCTAREHHPLLRKQFPELAPHQILGKWLYLSQVHPKFESIVEDIVGLVRRNDPRIGVEPKPKKVPKKRRKVGSRSKK